MELLSVFPGGRGGDLTEWNLGDANPAGWLCSLDRGEGWAVGCCLHQPLLSVSQADGRMGVAASLLEWSPADPLPLRLSNALFLPCSLLSQCVKRKERDTPVS